MIYDKALIISRYHEDSSNPIYNSYIKGIQSQCNFTHFIDYFDQINALGKNGFEKQTIKTLEKENINLVFFIFVSGDVTIDPYFIETIAKDRFIAMVFWDMEQFFEQIDRYYAQLADLVILSANYEYSKILKTYNIESICPFSLFDKDKYKPSEHINRTIDVSFVGEVTKGKRKEYIEYLIDNNIQIESYGVGTKNGKVSFNKVVDIFNKSKINLSFTGTYANNLYSFTSNINNHILQNKGKPIEIALCNGFILTEYVESLNKVFETNSIDMFKDKKTLLKKINYYLEHREEREAMAKKAYQYAIKNYDSEKGFEKIFKMIDIMQIKDKKIILDKKFLQIHNTFHIYYLIVFLSNYRFKSAIEELKYIRFTKGFHTKDIVNFSKYLIKFRYKRFLFNRHCNKIFKNLKNKDIVIYGAGIHTLNLFKNFEIFKTLNIMAIADQNKTLWGTKINKIPIISPKEIHNYANTVIISSFKFENDIKQYLIQEYNNKLELHTLYNSKYNEDLISDKIDIYQIYKKSIHFI